MAKKKNNMDVDDKDPREDDGNPPAYMPSLMIGPSPTYCPHCRKGLPPASPFCPYCGKNTV